MTKKTTLSIVTAILIIFALTIFFISSIQKNKLVTLNSNEEITDATALPSTNNGTATITSSYQAASSDPLTFKASLKTDTEATQENAIFAGGCFWCVEHDLEKLSGVLNAVSGYAGGSSDNPTYKNYANGGHREVVLVTYNPQIVSYANLVEHIIKHGDPTDATGSFNDRGREYAPAIYYKNATEQLEARKVIDAIDALQIFQNPLPLEVLPNVKFWPAEEYHQDYAKKNSLRYNYYRGGSGRNDFIKKYWGNDAAKFTVTALPEGDSENDITSPVASSSKHSWVSFVKPSEVQLRSMLTQIRYAVTQDDDTEPPFNNEYDKNYAEGIYVDIVSGEPLYLSKDKYDSGTGWPSFVKPISLDVVNLKEEKKFFTTRTEVRSRYADSHLGHVFDDGPSDRGGKRYCMNSAALRFVPIGNMEKEGYGNLLVMLLK